MTIEEKKMKKYVNAIERRLNLPKDVKARVMSDFSSSIQARRETGMTDEEIYAELGDAKKAAAELNAQMKEYAYRKSPWRFVCLALAIYGLWQILPGIWINLVYLWLRVYATLTPAESHSVGVIGGADGPTAIFLTTPIWATYIVPVFALVAGVWGYLRLRRCKPVQRD